MIFFRKELKNKRTILLAIIAMIIFVIYCSFIVYQNFEVIWPTEKVLFQQKNNYRRLRADVQKAEKLHEEFVREENAVAEKVRTFYKDDDKLKADIYMRQRIEHAAKFSNLILKSMSSVNRKIIKEGTFSLEINISAEGTFEKVVTLFQELSRNKAGIYWVNCYMRRSSTKKETLITVSGGFYE